MNALLRYFPALLAVLFGSLALAAGEEGVELQAAPGRDVVVARCSVCHSVDYVQMNAPVLDRAGWQKSVRLNCARGSPLQHRHQNMPGMTRHRWFGCPRKCSDASVFVRCRTSTAG